MVDQKETEVEQEQPKELTKEQQKMLQNAQLMHEFQRSLQVFDQVSLTLTSRQMGRVIRALMKAPFEEPEKFQDAREKTLFNLGMRIQDTKILLVMEHQSEIEKGLKEVHSKAQELETKGEE